MLFFGKRKASLGEVIALFENFGGAGKRIDENRELFQLIKEKAPGMLAENPHIESLLRTQDAFLVELKRVSGTEDPLRDRCPDRGFPHRWPW